MGFFNTFLLVAVVLPTLGMGLRLVYATSEPCASPDTNSYLITRKQLSFALSLLEGSSQIFCQVFYIFFFHFLPLSLCWILVTPRIWSHLMKSYYLSCSSMLCTKNCAALTCASLMLSRWLLTSMESNPLPWYILYALRRLLQPLRGPGPGKQPKENDVFLSK